LPSSVAVLPALEYLDVHANALSGPLPAIWDTPKLTIFRGEDNRISGALPEPLFRQPLLEQVFLHSNALSGSLPASLTDAANLHSLLLADNALSGPIPADIGRDHNRLSGSIPAGLADRLTVFDVSYNPDLAPAP
jgi:hypothetical protein